MLGGLMLLDLGIAGTTVMQNFWHLIILWGFVIGIGVAELSSAMVVSIAHR